MIYILLNYLSLTIITSMTGCLRHTAPSLVQSSTNDTQDKIDLTKDNSTTPIKVNSQSEPDSVTNDAVVEKDSQTQPENISKSNLVLLEDDLLGENKPKEETTIKQPTTSNAHINNNSDKSDKNVDQQKILSDLSSESYSMLPSESIVPEGETIQDLKSNGELEESSFEKSMVYVEHPDIDNPDDTTDKYTNDTTNKYTNDTHEPQIERKSVTNTNQVQSNKQSVRKRPLLKTPPRTTKFDSFLLGPTSSGNNSTPTTNFQQNNQTSPKNSDRVHLSRQSTMYSNRISSSLTSPKTYENNQSSNTLDNTNSFGCGRGSWCNSTSGGKKRGRNDNNWFVPLQRSAQYGEHDLRKKINSQRRNSGNSNNWGNTNSNHNSSYNNWNRQRQQNFGRRNNYNDLTGLQRNGTSGRDYAHFDLRND